MILAPTTYIFFASALPVIVFGEQLNRETDGSLSTVDTLASTAVCSIIHSMFGGQPLLILGVAEPTVIMYTYLYNFTKEKANLGQELFLSWAVCVWTAILLLLPVAFNACTIISRFTRIAGELFGTLIAVLFMQEAIKGLMATKFHCRLWGSLYGSNMVTNVIWCTYQSPFRSSQEALWSTSMGVCIFAPLDGNQADMGKVSVVYTFAAFIPTVMIAILTQAILFNETITQTLLCGLIGLPPANGVLPQSPMHTKSLVVLKRQVIDQKEDGKECQGMHKQQGSNSEIYGRMQAVFIEMDTTPDHAVAKELKNLKDAVMKVKMEEAKMVMIWKNTSMLTCLFGLMSKRVSNLLQSLLVGALLLAMPAIMMIPTSILRGYFAYMALDSLPGNQFCERILLSFLLHLKDGTILEGDHASFVELMPFSYHLLPKLFHSQYLQELDVAEYEEIAGNQNCSQSMPFKDGDKPLTGNENHEFEISDAEILDELTTYNGELKFRSASFSDECGGSSSKG
ncbi:unnamed protein product [Camellia sinensis]